MCEYRIKIKVRTYGERCPRFAVIDSRRSSCARSKLVCDIDISCKHCVIRRIQHAVRVNSVLPIVTRLQYFVMFKRYFAVTALYIHLSETEGTEIFDQVSVYRDLVGHCGVNIGGRLISNIKLAVSITLCAQSE